MWQFWVPVGALWVAIWIISFLAQKGAKKYNSQALIRLRDTTDWLGGHFIHVLVTFIAVVFIGGFLTVVLDPDENFISLSIPIGFIIVCLLLIRHMWKKDE